MTTIYLVRHGETDWNVAKRAQGQTDIPLNATGIQQAEACGAALNPKDYDIVITSQLQRARKTAEIINNLLELPFKVMGDFAERSFGDAEGLTLEERNKLFPDRNYPNQEVLEDFSERIMTGLEHVHQNYVGKRILLVAHGAVIYRMLSIISEGTIDIGVGGRKIENTSISTIIRDGESWVMQDYNRVDHLKKVQAKA